MAMKSYAYYLPGRAFKISVAVFVLGAVLFFLGYCLGMVELTNGNPRPNSQLYGLEVAFAYALETFVPLLKIGVAEKWEPTGPFLRIYFLLHRVAGWILTALWFSALT